MVAKQRTQALLRGQARAHAHTPIYTYQVDTKHIVQHLDEEKPEGAENEAVEQVAFADRLIMNKCDLVPNEADQAAVEARLRAINKFAPIVRTTKSEVSVENVLNLNAFDLNKTLEMDPEFLDTEAEHEHDESVTSCGIDLVGEVDLTALQVRVWVLVCAMKHMNF